jgi:hypothetical protein
MPIERLPDSLEPDDTNAALWRFVNFDKFSDLIATQELHFCRADLFDDDQEGMPPDEFMRGYFYPITRDDHLGSSAQFREAFFVSCWHLFVEETATMWHRFGKNGVAVCTQYSLLQNALNMLPDRVFLEQVRYGHKHLEGQHENVIRLMSTKRKEHEYEREVRAFLWIPDELAGINRHYDENNVAHPRPLTPPPDRVPKFHRRKVDVRTLLLGVVVNPWCDEAFIPQVEELILQKSLSIPVRPSELSKWKQYLPSSSDVAKIWR